ncbi:hypothetical protein ABS754_002900 [Listeria monocytogenes]|nr:hypothetical protein [Listeria monocytogenes]EAD6491138.1 hypothetical protein [Listeria monocytogenes]ECJ9734450.1 hypothetical protein [Listeria monocytogenes]EHT7657632.1 hypothetical protein [Listeria monocytogenes]
MNDNEVTKKETGLIIIGNGLDINSGLSSRFIQYYKARCAKLGLIINENYNLVDAKAIQVNIMRPDGEGVHAIRDIVSICAEGELRKHITFWDLVLIFSDKITGDENWCNIERTIFDVVFDLRGYLEKTFEQSILKLSYSKISITSSPYIKNLLSLVKDFNDNHKKYIWFLAYIEKIRENDSDYKDITLERFLLLELNKYENDFMEYINETTSANEEYLNERKTSIQQMIDDNPNLTNINIMNFNFTCDIFESLTDNQIELGTEVNVHGKVNSKVIFGIDTKSLETVRLDLGYDLTKTSRKLAMNKEKAISVLDKTISTIIFYGHSLSEADYAYFQSLFDYLDIYNNPIKLTFYYTNYLKGEQDLETVRREQTKAVRKLIVEYGSTLDNEAKGKNLLHKLLLEERIGVFELE